MKNAFFSDLSAPDLQWLEGHLKSAREPIPEGWEQWKLRDDSAYFAGCVPKNRLEHLATRLPQFSKDNGFWTWDTNAQPIAMRNDLLQSWLRHQYECGYMTEWHDEMQDWFPSDVIHRQMPGDSGLPALTVERCGFRYLGLRSPAVHVNGFTHDGRLMVGQRAMSKSQDPGLFDNLMAGGMSAGENWEQTLQRELYEEAGMICEPSSGSIKLAGSVDTCRQDHEVWHSETLIVCNLLLEPGENPKNRDGEVQQFVPMSAPEAIQRMKDGLFTRDGIISLAYGLGFRPKP